MTLMRISFHGKNDLIAIEYGLIGNGYFNASYSGLQVWFPLGKACPRQGRAKFCVRDIPGAVRMAKTLLMDLSCCSEQSEFKPVDGTAE